MNELGRPEDQRAALIALAEDQPGLETVQLSGVNPETGAPAENMIGFHALQLRRVERAHGDPKRWFSGSSSPASAKPLARSRQESQAPQGRPSTPGS